jgi:hypothetical protein
MPTIRLEKQKNIKQLSYHDTQTTCKYCGQYLQAIWA